MIPVVSHVAVKNITLLRENGHNQCRANLLNLPYHRPPEVSEISNLLQDDGSKGLSDVKDFMRIDIDIDDWITKTKKG